MWARLYRCGSVRSRCPTASMSYFWLPSVRLLRYQPARGRYARRRDAVRLGFPTRAATSADGIDATTRPRADASTHRPSDASTRGRIDAWTRRRVDTSTRRRVQATSGPHSVLHWSNGGRCPYCISVFGFNLQLMHTFLHIVLTAKIIFVVHF